MHNDANRFSLVPVYVLHEAMSRICHLFPFTRLCTLSDHHPWFYFLLVSTNDGLFDSFFPLWLTPCLFLVVENELYMISVVGSIMLTTVHLILRAEPGDSLIFLVTSTTCIESNFGQIGRA